jgi:peptidyl-prolyl cis-trans isomerase SurA
MGNTFRKALFSFSGYLLGMLWLLAVPAGSAQAQLKSINDGIAAIVNKEVITLSELEAELRDETIRLRARYSGKELEQRLTHKEYDVLNRIIERKLQLQEAKAKGIHVSDEELDQAIEELRQSQPGVADSTPRSRLQEELILRRMLDFEVRRRLMVSPEEVRSYYTKSQEEFTAPAQYHLRQILLKPQLGESSTDLLARAQVLVKQLKAGANFSELAKQHSEGSESILGGDLGFMRKEELLGPLARAVGGMTIGEVSAPVETELGVHILMLEETTPGEPLPFEDVKDAIKNNLFQRKTRDVRQEWLSSLKDKAYIEIRF